MTLYVDRRHLFDIKRIEEDGFEMTRAGKVPCVSGDVIITNEYGRVGVVSETYFNKNYIEVEKVKKKSSFADAYAQSLMEFSLDSSFEDDEYISKTKDMHKVVNK
jgi:hypothetical protein